MPLKNGKSEAALQANIKTEINAGKKPKQAEAIAYSKQRESEDNDEGTTFKIYDKEQIGQSSREPDINGWAEIKGNPISKVGVFPYLGKDINPDLEPDKLYNVYRPETELSNAETIESFKLLPWTDEHAMLGSEDEGMLPAEKKGIHGVIGEDVYFEDGYLKGNIKIFSDKLANLIEAGKKELSIGYRCLYDMVSGVYDGVKYDAIQRNIRGNHLALVGEGRSGHDVAVLDQKFKFQFDTKELQMPDMKREGEIQDEEMSLGECVKMLKELSAKVDKMMKSEGDEGEEEGKKELSEKAAKEGDAKDEEGEYNKFVNKAEVEDDEPSLNEEEEMSQDEDNDKKGDMSKPKDKKSGMDSKISKLTKDVNRLKNFGAKELFNEISRRDALANKLSAHIGTFDHANKTFDEVAQYGVKKLSLRCTAGHEASMLEGFLAAAKTNSVVTHGQDSNVKSGCIDAYLNGGE